MKKKTGRRILSVFLAVSLMITSVICGNFADYSATAQAATRDEAVAWANAQIGKGLDYDGAYGNQCVDLIKYYYDYFGVAGYAKGNANAYITNALPPGWTRVYGDYQPGDIAVWKVNHSCGTCNTSAYGHVGIIISADSVGFNAVNQNFNNQSYCTRNWFNILALACAIRPSYTSNVPAQPAVPNITFADFNQNGVWDTNAEMYVKVMNPDKHTVSTVGCYLYNANGDLIKNYSENCGLSTSYVNYNCNLNNDMQITLTPGTTYYFEMYAIVDGQEFKDSRRSFTTTGQAPVKVTPTPIVTPTPTVTPTPVVTPTSTVTSTPVVTPTSTVTPTPVVTPTPTVTPTSQGKVTLPPQTQAPDNPGSQLPGDTQTDGKWNTIYFGRYWQDDTNGDGTADKKDEMQPIQWRILRQDGNYALLLADKILDSGKYYKGEESSWETSDLRNWLNSNFYATAFNEKEQKAIQVQILQNGDGKDPILLTTNTTMDKVFVPSHDDMLRSEYGFGNAAYNEADNARIASNTKYTAGKPGMYSSTECADAYWLRNSSNSLSSAQAVMTQGILSPSISVQTISGVRPMIYVDLSDQSLWKSGTQVRSGKMGEAGSINGITSTSDGNFVLSDNYYPFGKVSTGDNNVTPKPDQPATDTPAPKQPGGSPTPSASDETKISATPLPSASAKAAKTEYRVNIDDDDDISAPAKPGKVKIKKASALKNGKVKLTWKKPARAKWYIIQYSTKRNFAGAKVGIVYGRQTTLRLKKNRTYYIRIRAYAYGNSANNNRAVNGKWSQVKKVKTKG